MDRDKATTSKRITPRGSLGIYGRLVLLLLVVLIPIFIIQALIHYERLQMRRANELQSNLEVSRAVGRSFGAFVEDVLHHELAVGIAATASPPLPHDGLTRLLDAGGMEHPAIRSLEWVGPDGRILIASNPEAVGLDISDRPFFQEIASGCEWAVSDLFICILDGQPVFTISRGIRDGKGNLLGVVVAGILPDLLDSVLAIERTREGGVSLMDSRGMLVYRFPHIQAGWEERKWAEIFPSSVPKALGGKETVEIVPTTPYDGKSRMVAATPIRSIGWVAGAGRREEDAMEEVTSALIRHGSMFLSVALGSFLAAILIARTIAAPIKALQERAHRFRQGMLDSPLESAGPWEVRHLAATLNQMAAEIRHWMEETRALAERAEERAREAEEGRRLLHALMEHVPEGITIADAPDVTIRMVSRYGRNVLGEAREGLTAQEVANQWKVFSEGRRTPLAAEDLPLSRAILRGETIQNAELIYINATGERLSLLCNAAPIRDGSGRILGGIAAWRDVSEMRRMQDALRESEKQVRRHLAEIEAIYATAPVGLCVLDTELRWVRLNERIAELNGVPVEAHIGKTYRDIVPDISEQAEAAHRRILEMGEPFLDFEMSGTTAAQPGVLRYCNERWVPLKDDTGRIIGISVAVVEITERKRAEEALRKAHDELELRVRERTAELTRANQALMESERQLRMLSSRLLAAQEEERKRVAHELHDSIGSSLGTIRFTLENTLVQVQDGTVTPESIKEIISIVEQTVEDARRIYTDLRPSMLEHLGILPTIGWFCRQFESAHNALCIEKHIEVEEERVPESLKIVIFRIMQESFHNIAKYSRADLVRFSLTEANGLLELVISDNGVGFDAGAAFTTIPEKGGIGLTSMRERVQLSGGTFAIESAIGEGTTLRASWDCSKVV